MGARSGRLAWHTCPQTAKKAKVFSLWLAFSSATSSDLRLLATTRSSSSRSTILVSPVSARSSVFSRSDSHWTSFLESSSKELSAASAFSLASFSSFPRPEILSSSSAALLWNTFLARSESSSAVAALSCLATAATILVSVFSRSSSSPETPLQGSHLELGGGEQLLLLLQLEGGDAEPLGGNIELGLKLPGLGHQLVNLVLALGGTDPGSLAGLLADIDPVTGVVLLHLHRLHLLLDGLHGEAVEEGSETTLAGGRLPC